MKVEEYSFGWIKIEGKEYTHDLWIINGEIYKRDKGLSKRLFQTSHRIPMEELEKILRENTKRVIIGTGEDGLVSVEENGAKYLEEKGIKLEMYKTGELAKMKLQFGKDDSGIIHLTC
ncbi:MAG: hypothetical protein CVT88_02560 [Candidatus Altiarchaeales archaeon HGW-Altiarchaeales-1]|nr:MAG: hypothetical protein CVT88_02560 [Candidatus Altiarchaeales archaeon HGW-Altiarchaeales-1]